MILTHYSKKPIVGLDRKYPKLDNKHSPGGFWLTDESANISWKHVVRKSAESDPCWLSYAQQIGYKTHFQIIDQDLGTVKHIKNTDELSQFALDYGEPLACHPEQMPGVHIQWERVRQDYKGILIIPYLADMSHRTDKLLTHWYRFDCASGCFWDTCCLQQLLPSQPINPDQEFNLSTPKPRGQE